MKNVVVITGGGSGMGLAAAKCMPKEKIIVISGRTEAKLEKGVQELKELGYEAYGKACDTSSRESVRALAEYCASLGEIKNVVNSAGLSPAMVDGATLLRVNALGTVYVNQEFSKFMHEGSAICDISSNSSYLTPNFLLPTKYYPLAETDEELFMKKVLGRAKIVKDPYQNAGMVYSMSKNFVRWYARKSAFDLGKRGIRVCSLSPGLIATDMGNKEKENGGGLITASCEKRMGKPEELGFAIAMAVDERNGYFAAFDILVDGGATCGLQEYKLAKMR